MSERACLPREVKDDEVARLGMGGQPLLECPVKVLAGGSDVGGRVTRQAWIGIPPQVSEQEKVAAVPARSPTQPGQDAEGLLHWLATALGPGLGVKSRADAHNDGPDLPRAGCGARPLGLGTDHRPVNKERTGQEADQPEASIHGDVSTGERFPGIRASGSRRWVRWTTASPTRSLCELP